MTNEEPKGTTRSDLDAALAAQDAQDGGDRRWHFRRDTAINDFAAGNPIIAIVVVAIGASLFAHVGIYVFWGFFIGSAIEILAAFIGHFGIKYIAKKYADDKSDIIPVLCNMYVSGGTHIQIVMWPIQSAATIGLFFFGGGFVLLVLYILYIFWMITLPVVGVIFAICLAIKFTKP